MEAKQGSLSGVVERSVKHLMEGLEYHVVGYLYRRFRDMLGFLRSRCFANTQRSIKYGNYLTLSGLKGLEG